MSEETSVSRRKIIAAAGTVAAVGLAGNMAAADEGGDKGKAVHGEHIRAIHPKIAEILKRSNNSNSTTFTFPEWHSGDCVMWDISMTFFEDGHGEFKSKVKTNHTSSGDIWHADFYVKDRNGLQLFHLGQWDSPVLWEHQEYPFNVTFYFQQAHYPFIVKIDGTGSC